MFFAKLTEEGGRVYAIAISTLSLDGVSIFMAKGAHVSGEIWSDSNSLALKEGLSIHMLQHLIYIVTVRLSTTQQQLAETSMHVGVMCVSEIVVTSDIALQCLVVGFTLTIAPLN